jgi:Cell wall-associated hydrolases (invasion-associated proteins)
MKRKAAGIVIVCAAGMALYAGPVYAAAPDSAAAAVNAAAEQGQEIRVESIKEVVSMPVGAAALLDSRKTEEEYKEAAQEAEGALWGYTNLGISNVNDNLNIRKTPGEDGKMVGKLPKNAACELISEEGEWTYIRSGKVEGYVKSEYLLSGWNAKKRALEEVSTVAVVDTTTLKVREQPNTECEVITMVPRGEELDVVEIMDDWVKIMIDDEENYVSAEYVIIEEKLASAITMTELLYGQGVSNIRVDLCQFAKQYVGNPYVWGGTSLTKGADCSGFVLSVFKNFGISLPRTSGSQSNAGTKISMSEAKPGDLIFYAKGGRINHVAIYIGNGQVVHASSPKTGIKISNYNYRTPAKVVRVLPKD